MNRIIRIELIGLHAAAILAVFLLLGSFLWLSLRLMNTYVFVSTLDPLIHLEIREFLLRRMSLTFGTLLVIVATGSLFVLRLLDQTLTPMQRIMAQLRRTVRHGGFQEITLENHHYFKGFVHTLNRALLDREENQDQPQDPVGPLRRRVVLTVASEVAVVGLLMGGLAWFCLRLLLASIHGVGGDPRLLESVRYLLWTRGLTVLAVFVFSSLLFVVVANLLVNKITRPIRRATRRLRRLESHGTPRSIPVRDDDWFREHLRAINRALRVQHRQRSPLHPDNGRGKPP